MAGFSTVAGLAVQSVILKPHDFEAVIAIAVFKEVESFLVAYRLINPET